MKIYYAPCRVLVVLAAAMLMISGCGHMAVKPGETFNQLVSAEDDTALVYFYRPSHLLLSALEYGFYIDGEPTIALASASHGSIKVAPGKHTFLSQINHEVVNDPKHKERPLSFDYTVEAGKTYFIAWNPIKKKNRDEYYLVSAAHSETNNVSAALGPISIGGKLNISFGVVNQETALPELKKTGITNSVFISETE